MDNKQKTIGILGTGLAILTVGFTAAARPAAAQPPLLASCQSCDALVFR